MKSGSRKPVRKMETRKKPASKRKPTIKEQNSMLFVLMLENGMAQGRPITHKMIRRLSPTFFADSEMVIRILEKRKTPIETEH